MTRRYEQQYRLDQAADHIASAEELRRWIRGISDLQELSGPLPESIDNRVQCLQKALAMALRESEERDEHAAKNYKNRKNQ